MRLDICEFPVRLDIRESPMHLDIRESPVRKTGRFTHVSIILM